MLDSWFEPLCRVTAWQSTSMPHQFGSMLHQCGAMSRWLEIIFPQEVWIIHCSNYLGLRSTQCFRVKMLNSQQDYQSGNHCLSQTEHYVPFHRELWIVAGIYWQDYTMPDYEPWPLNMAFSAMEVLSPLFWTTIISPNCQIKWWIAAERAGSEPISHDQGNQETATCEVRASSVVMSVYKRLTVMLLACNSLTISKSLKSDCRNIFAVPTVSVNTHP